MKRKLYTVFGLLILFVVGSLKASAQKALVLETNDGKTYSYVLAKKPQLTFNDTEMLITSADANASFVRKDIKNFHFEDATAIKDVVKEGQRMTYLGGVVTVEGADNVVLYDISGRQIMSKRSAGGESVTIDLSSQPRGTYIVRSGKQSLKVQR